MQAPKVDMVYYSDVAGKCRCKSLYEAKLMEDGDALQVSSLKSLNVRGEAV